MHTETRPQYPLQMCMLQRRPSTAGTALHARVCFAKETDELTHSVLRLRRRHGGRDAGGGAGEEFGNQPPTKKVPRIKKMKAEGDAKHDRFFDFIPLATKEFK